MFESLYRHICARVPLTREEFSICESLFEHRRYRKHQYILQEGEISRYESFVIKGIARTYEVDDRGVEHIIQFAPEDWWVGDMYSFLTGTPSRCNIDCLEDVEVLQITREKQDILFDKQHKIERFFRLLVQKAYIASIQRVYSNMSKPATERYLDFIHKYPDIEQRVSNQQIASYLGITAPSLSRIRASLVNRHS